MWIPINALVGTKAEVETQIPFGNDNKKGNGNEAKF
jgi:hypothetical protein